MAELLSNELVWLALEGAVLGVLVVSGVGAVGALTWGVVRAGVRHGLVRGGAYFVRRHMGLKVAGAVVGAYLNLQSGGNEGPPLPPPVPPVATGPCTVRCAERATTGSAIRCTVLRHDGTTVSCDTPTALERAFAPCLPALTYVDDNAGRAVRDAVRLAAEGAGRTLVVAAPPARSEVAP